MFDVSLSEIQKFLVTEVKNNVDFDTLCNDLLGESLNYYRGSDLKGYAEKLPYMTSYKFNVQSNENQDDTWIVQYIIGISSDVEPITDNGIVSYNITDKVEKLASSALTIIKDGLRSGGLLGNCNIRIAGANMIITEVGEATDDVQAIVTLRLENYKLI
jgi:hypothetical protein